MKPTKKTEHLSALLPGLEWSATVEKAKDRNDTPERHGRWWVRSSAQQKICPATGQPLGCRHSLMRGSQIIRNGVGTDDARAFTAQADFLNTHELSNGIAQPCSPLRMNTTPSAARTDRQRAAARDKRRTLCRRTARTEKIEKH
jgi:hypothetical protein